MIASLPFLALATRGSSNLSSKVNLFPQLTLGPDVLQIWSRDTLDLRGVETFVLHRADRALTATGRLKRAFWHSALRS